jgi:hypothetical protein
MLAIAVVVAVLAGPLVLGVLFPWEPPKEASKPAVVRVMSPPGKHYRVEWGGAWWQFWREERGFVAKVDEGHIAKDHPVQPTSEGAYEFTVRKVASQRGGGYEEVSPGWEGDLRAVLYVGGEIATCDAASGQPLKLAWHEGDGTNRLATRALCDKYRWSRVVPGYLTMIAWIAAPFLLLTLVGLAGAREQEARDRLEAEKRREKEEQARQREEEKRRRIESLLHRDAVRDEINYMSGPEFERFMADLLRTKGHTVRETRATGDQGVDLLVDIDEKKVAVQLKRWNAPVGNAAVQATFAGIAHYQADEGWIITTSTFTKSARELARSTRVRLIDGKELANWLEGLREQEE